MVNLFIMEAEQGIVGTQRRESLRKVPQGAVGQGRDHRWEW